MEKRKTLRKVILLLFTLVVETPVFACYGAGCSTYCGGAYDAPWKVYHKTVPVVYTNPTSILDNPKEYLDISNYSNKNLPQTPNVYICQNGKNCIPTVGIRP